MKNMPELWELATTPAFDSSYSVVTDGQRRFRVRVPVSDAEKNRGYRQVKDISQDECMLFMYDEPGPMTYTMEHCLVGLRIVFCDKLFNVLQVSDAEAGVKRVECSNAQCQNVIEFALRPNPPECKSVKVITRFTLEQDMYGMPAFFASVFGLN
jgi:uncharacterized membrane protein (UPF0127 family)